MGGYIRLKLTEGALNPPTMLLLGTNGWAIALNPSDLARQGAWRFTGGGWQTWTAILYPSTSAQCMTSSATFALSSFQNSITPDSFWFWTCIWADPIKPCGLKISYSCTSVKPGGNCLTRWWVAQGQCSGGCKGDIRERLRWTGRRMPRIAWPFNIARAFSATYCRQYMCRALVRVC